MDIEKYRKIFTQESEKYLDELDRLLIEAEKDLGNPDLWAKVHGKVHSIKGMAKAVSYDRIADLSHGIESWCKQYQQGVSEVRAEAFQMILNGTDMLRALVLNAGEIESVEDQQWYDSLLSQFGEGPEKLHTKDRAKPASARITSAPDKIDYVRIKYSLIEELLGLSQEILLLEKTLPPLALEHASMGLKTWIGEYASILKSLHFRLGQLRLISVGDFAEIFVKTIRNMARENGKEVRMEVIGGTLEADITLLERLREPIMHIFRNAIVHGIESPHEREENGKSAWGTIRLEARRIRDKLFIKIADDGRGIDRASITEYLKREKSMTSNDISLMSGQEFLNTIISPDFSSASATSHMAGRGIGMSVVSQTIERLGGAMTITSEISKGTEFVLQLPLSLSIVHAVTFKLGEYILSIPTSYVDFIEKTMLSEQDGSRFSYDLRGFLRAGGGKDKGHIITLKHLGDDSKGDSRMADIEVDKIIENRPIMVMPVEDPLAKVGLFSGIGIMENGEISILLDMESFPEMPESGGKPANRT